jgi:hypothetical protein
MQKPLDHAEEAFGDYLRGRQRLKRRVSAHVFLGAGGPTNACLSHCDVQCDTHRMDDTEAAGAATRPYSVSIRLHVRCSAPRIRGTTAKGRLFVNTGRTTCFITSGRVRAAFSRNLACPLLMHHWRRRRELTVTLTRSSVPISPSGYRLAVSTVRYTAKRNCWSAIDADRWRRQVLPALLEPQIQETALTNILSLMTLRPGRTRVAYRLRGIDSSVRSQHVTRRPTSASSA